MGPIFSKGGPGQPYKKSSDVFFFFFQGSRGGATFSRGGGGSNFFQGGSSCLLPLETHITCDFLGMRWVLLFQIKCWFSGLEFTKCLSEKQTGKTLIKLLLQKQPDMGLHFLSKPFFGRQLAFKI